MQWMGIAFAVGIFCVVRGGFDLRERRYGWAALGILGGLFLILAPIPTHAIKLDLLSPSGG